MTNVTGQVLNRVKKFLLANVGLAVMYGSILITLDALPSRAQIQQNARLAFDVASIRAHQGPVSRIGLSISGTLVTVAAYTVGDLITDGYGMKDYQVAGVTGWIGSDRYDIAARSAGESAPTRDQARQMLQTLLTERFQLKIHQEMKEMSVYALVIGKRGPKLKENTADTPMWRMSGKGLDTQMTFTSSPIEQLVTQLAHIPGVGRPVLDKTGLPGRYDFQLNLTRDLPGTSTTGPEGQSVFTAIEEQLGLRLESQKAPIGVLVIDHVEKPSEN
jgi:uncharacterized protein (TIGR03435 family)